MSFGFAQTVSERPFGCPSEEELLSLVRSSPRLLLARDQITPKPEEPIYRDHLIWRPLFYAACIFFLVGSLGEVFLVCCRSLLGPLFVIAFIASIAKGYSISLTEFEECKRRMEETRLNAGTKELILDLSAGQLLMHENFSLSGENKTTSSPLAEVQILISHDIDDDPGARVESIEVRLDSLRLESASAWARDVLDQPLRSFQFADAGSDRKLQAESRAMAMIQAINSKLTAAGHHPLSIANR